MDALSLAFVIYSSQILLIVSAAAMAGVLLRMARPAARLGYWRAIGLLCLALPLVPSGGAHSPATASVTFSMLPAQGAVVQTVAKSLPTVGSALLWIWACGAIAGLTWLLVGAYRLRQTTRRSAPASLSPDIDAMRLALAPHAVFRWSEDVHQPVTLGIRRPLVLLPRRFDELTRDAQRAVACHELLHIERRDWLWTVLEAHIRALFWFHPAIWWLIDRIQLLREQVIDQLVVARTSTRRDYMQALVLFADSQRPAMLSSAFLRRRHLRSRLGQLVKEKYMSSRRLLCTVSMLMLIVGGATIATVRALPLEVGALAQTGAPSRMVIRLAETSPADGLREVLVPGSNERIYLHAQPLATWEDVSLVKIVDAGSPQFGVVLTFERAAASRLASATAAHVGRPLAILLDGRVVSVLTLRGPIGDSAVLTGLSPAVAQQLVDANLACHTNPAQCAAAVLPVPIHQEKPQYTQAAMAAQIEGPVLLEATVLADGSTGDVKVVQSLDSTLGLDDEAVKALKQWTWKPGTRGGQPSNVMVQIEMKFTLD
jgi:TonB family protein